MKCTTCNRPVEDGYVNRAADERCVDASHDPYLGPAQRADARAVRERIALAARSVERTKRALYPPADKLHAAAAARKRDQERARRRAS